MLGLYVHIPFCSSICPYCDFTVLATKSPPEERYIAALIKELEQQTMRKGLAGSELRSIFWGGGTPSLMSAGAIEKLHETVDQLFQVNWKTVEISLEGNPKDISKEKAKELSAAGINRLSIGAQSLNAKVLKRLGRKHSKRDIQNAVTFAKDAGIHNVNCDLIFGVPEQTTTELEEDIYGYVELQLTHISTYSLTIEKGTPFFKAVASGAMPKPEDSETRRQYERILELLPQFRYEHYEVSNFALSGYECRHNIGYWDRSSYLGIGVGAHSFLLPSNERWSNLKGLPDYLHRIEQNDEPLAWFEALTPQDTVSEKILLSLRKREGLLQEKILSSLSESQASRFLERIQDLVATGLLEQESLENHNIRIRLTQEGFCVADSVIESLIASTL